MRIAIVCGALALLAGCGSATTAATTSPAATSGDTVGSSPAGGSEASTSTSTTTVETETTTTVDPAVEAINAGASIGRQWAPTGPIAWVVEPDGAPDAPQQHLDEFPAGTAVVGAEALPSSSAASAFDLAAAAGRAVFGLGAHTSADDGELAALSGLVGSTDQLVLCDRVAFPADVVCASFLGTLNADRVVGYRVLDHGATIGDADIVFDSTGAWRIASWTVRAGPGDTSTTLAAPSSVPVTPTVASAAGCQLPTEPGHDFPIRRGDSGETVRRVQALLILLGFNVGSSGADGQYGPDTEAAVRSFKGTEGVPGGDTVCMEDFNLMVQLTESGTGENP